MTKLERLLATANEESLEEFRKIMSVLSKRATEYQNMINRENKAKNKQG